MKCGTCGGTGESSQPLEGIGTLRAPCSDCNGKGERADHAGCDHADRTPAFMRGSFYCNKCNAKLHVHDDGTIEVRGQP